MPTTSPFHAGERAVQQRAGETVGANHNSAMIAHTILAGARPFIERQRMVVLASVDWRGAAWASVLYGQQGFAQADSDTLVTLHVPAGRRAESDPFWTNIAASPAVGMLFIDLGTRHRYRINGVIVRNDAEGIGILVREAYPNCPKFIQRRRLAVVDETRAPSGDASGSSIAGSVRTLIRNADTVFVASQHSGAGADASHRGGNPGFVQVLDKHRLRIPDYPGNSLFNTLGNVELDPHVGLCIPDFEGRRLLQLTGSARVLWDQDDPADLSGGTGRFWEVEVDRWILRQVPQRLEWDYLDASPFNPSVAQP